MKKTFSIILLFLAVMAGSASAQPKYLPFYWIKGGVADVNSIKADGHRVIFYKDDPAKSARAVVSNNSFMLNAFEAGEIKVGQTYKIAVARAADGYGADPAEISISGRGWDEFNKLVLVAGGGGGVPGAPGIIVKEPPPKMKLWFGERLYQKAMVEAGRKFVVSDKPKVRVEVSIDEPFSVSRNIADYSIVVDPGTGYSKRLALNTANMTLQSYAADELKAFTIQYLIEENEKLEGGKHTFQIVAKSGGGRGIQASAASLATVEVMGGPLRLVSAPLTFPSPFSVTKQGAVTLQYELSADANIDIILVSIAGKRVKKFYFGAGAEGGSAGINKIAWDGRTDSGTLAGNGIYVGTILSRDEGRSLGNFKLTIVD